MKKAWPIPLLLAPALACAAGAGPQDSKPPDAGLRDTRSALHRTVADLDRRLFDAYNRCDLKAFRNLLADDLEFYHDQTGLMRGADATTAAIRDNICGKVRRELDAGSLEVDKIEGYGALELGSHRFCEAEGSHCMGSSRFLQIWKQGADGWKVTRIVSFAHRALPAAP